MNILTSTFDTYKKFQEESPFLKIFQIILFIWIFSIPLKNSIYQISTTLLIIIFFIQYFYYKEKTILLEILTTYKRLFIVFLLFLGSMALSNLIGISEQSALIDVFKYFIRYLFILVILLYFYKQSFFSRKWLLAAIFIVLSIHALDGIYQYITGFDLIMNKSPDRPSYLLTGAVFQHNPFGLFMAIGAMLSLTLFFDKNNHTLFKYDKVIYFTSLLLFLFTLFHSQSRAAWVMFGIYFIAFMFVYIKKNGINKKLFSTLVSLLIVSIILFLFDDNLSHRLTLLLQGNSAGRTTQIWPFIIEKITNAPMFGYGIDTYKTLTNGFPSSRHAGVHNLTLELLLYTGVVGFSLFSYLIWLTLKESFTEHKIVYFMLFASYIILMQFDGSLITGKLHTTIFILILFFIYSFRLEKNTSSSLK